MNCSTSPRLLVESRSHSVVIEFPSRVGGGAGFRWPRGLLAGVVAVVVVCPFAFVVMRRSSRSGGGSTARASERFETNN